MKTVGDLETTIERRLSQKWQLDIGGGESSWPYRINLGQPTSSDLESDFATWSQHAVAIRDWADQVGVVVEFRDRRVHHTTQPFPIAVTVPDLVTAATLCGSEWTERVARNKRRVALLRERFSGCAEYPKVLRLADRYSDVDFDLLLDATDWFDRFDERGMTPRQVPLPGVHAKWLNTRGPAVEMLLGRPLALERNHPSRIHFTYLDPDYLHCGGRQHDSATVGDVMVPVYQPSVVLIVENKDTAIHFPNVKGGIAIEGGGFGGSTAATFDWIVDAPHLFYWGDIDAEGFEILAGYRRDGLEVTSILMDLETYKTYALWGTHVLPNGKAISRRAPKGLVELTDEERDAYSAVCQPPDDLPPRVEQERIPLDVAAACVRSAPCN